LKSRDIFVDALCKSISSDGKLFLIHVEFQKNIRSSIPERLLEYNVLAHRQHKLPVFSCIVYLVDDGNIEESPIVWNLPDGSEVVRYIKSIGWKI